MSRSIALLAVLVPCWTPAAQASLSNLRVVFDNGSPNQLNGNQMAAWIQADDFPFSNATLVTGLQFWDLEAVGGSAFQGSISWFIYANSGGVPGAVISSGSASGAGLTHMFLQTLTIQGQTYSEYMDNFDIPLQAFAAGTYWLGLHNGPTSFTDFTNRFYWETTGSNSTFAGQQFLLPSGPWSTNGAEHAFELFGPVPEPSSLTLLGLGLAGFIGARYAAGRRPKSVNQEVVT